MRAMAHITLRSYVLKAERESAPMAMWVGFWRRWDSMAAAMRLQPLATPMPNCLALAWAPRK